MMKFKYIERLTTEQAKQDSGYNKKSEIIAHYYHLGIEARYRGRDKMYFLYKIIMED